MLEWQGVSFKKWKSRVWGIWGLWKLHIVYTTFWCASKINIAKFGRVVTEGLGSNFRKFLNFGFLTIVSSTWKWICIDFLFQKGAAQICPLSEYAKKSEVEVQKKPVFLVNYRPGQVIFSKFFFVHWKNFFLFELLLYIWI